MQRKSSRQHFDLGTPIFLFGVAMLGDYTVFQALIMLCYDRGKMATVVGLASPTWQGNQSVCYHAVRNIV